MAKAIFTDGTSQQDRMVPALREGYIHVDEMRLEDLLALAAQYAGLLRSDDDGDWRPFFESDELSILAGILATNLKRSEAALAGFERRAGDIVELLRDGSVPIPSLPAFALAAKLDGWFRSLGALPSVAAVRAYERLADLIGRTLAHELQALHAFLWNIDRGATEEAFREFARPWGLTSVPARVQAEYQGQAAHQFLKSNFDSFRNAVSYLQESAADLLPLSMGRQDHDPAVGLFVAFLKLFAGVQRKLNAFTRRHLNFYYGDVLKVPRRPFVPDSVHLLFATDVAGREVSIGRGTEFRGGADENNAERIYAADEELLVTDAKVRALHTLYLERNESISPENALSSGREQDSRQFVTAIKLNRIDPAEERSDAAGESAARPLFGDPERFGRKLPFEEARVGIAVASSVLLLKQGRRDICVTFKLAAATPEGSLGTFVRRLAEILETTEADAFFKAFRHMFRISLTTETGWFDVPEYLPLCRIVDENGCEDDCLKIRLRLADSAAAIVPYVRQVHGESFDTECPVIRFTLNPSAYLYPYGALSEMVVREILIEAEVTGCNSVLVYNQLGQLSNGTQFAPFGPLPSQGDYLVVGCYEAARKRLVAFEAELEWGGLPIGPKGFGEHYRAYPMKFGNDEFKARLAVLRDRKWIPSDESEQPETSLFESANGLKGDARIGLRRRLSFDGLCQFLRPIESVSEDRYGYDPATKDGFFRINLSHPGYAFGHKDYPRVLSQVMAENAMSKRFGLSKLLLKARPLKPLPNAPYTPLINSISVDYKAVATISLERVASADEDGRKDRVFHLHPLGAQALSPSAHGAIRLVPPFDAEGNLLIGLSASKLSGPLTLFFHLRQDSLPEADMQASRFSWHYLSSNEWKKLDRRRVASDTTNGFLSSGIVTLDIPSDIDRENTVLPPDLFWLRVSADGGRLRALCSLYAVHAHGVRATLKRTGGEGSSPLCSLPAGTIKEARSSIAGIAEIRQLMESSGGMPGESEEQWTIRVSERLKHKNRAVTPWDYERLVLEKFPEVFKVKCFPCLAGNEEDGTRARPGHLLIVLIPYPKEGASVNSEPMANARLLRDVREFVQSLSSPFATVNVRNPAYERIQVRLKVKLRNGVEHGRCLNRLNQEIVDYLSPWKEGGHEARFGWRIRCDEIQAHIQKLDYVETATGLSLLQIRQTDGDKHRLSDTVRLERSEIEPVHPWGIAVPFKRHLIEVVGEKATWPPEKTGIAELTIGSSFILSGGDR